MDAQVEVRRAERSGHGSRDSQQLVLGIVSLGTGIPITAIAGVTADLPGLMVAWAGIVGVNLASALRGRSRR